MACDQQTLLLISTYADGEASAEESQEARTHLEGCAECRKLLEDWRGQRTMFEWAYSIRLPEKVSIEKEELRMSNLENAQRWGFGLNRRWAWAGALVAAAVVILVIYHTAVLPPMLRGRLATSSEPQAARMENGIELNLGPHSIITRIGGRAIRLDRGSVTATIHHGSGFRVLTKRIEVTDQGTRFTVGTARKMDYVVVIEGLVEVRKGETAYRVAAGQGLIARDIGEPTVGSLPMVVPEENKPSTPLPENAAFVPTTGDDLDRQEAVEALARSFPELRRQDGWWRGTLEQDGLEFPYAIGIVDGLRNGLSTHFTEIAQAAAGEKIGPAEWEIPVCLLRVESILTLPQLPADTYYVRLIARGGVIVWRLSGSKGSQADYPFAFAEAPATGSRTNCKTEVGSVQLVHQDVTDRGESARFRFLKLMDWPDRLKPILKLKIAGAPVSASRKDERELLAMAGGTAGGLEDPTLLYLDSERKHRVMVAKYKDAGAQISKLMEEVGGRRGGSLALGVIVTDQPLEKPSAPAGVYLLRIVLPPSSKAAHWEIATADSRQVNGWKASSHALRGVQLGDDRYNGGNFSSGVDVSGRQDLTFTIGAGEADHGAFPFRFQLGSGKYSLADGCIWVKKP